MESNISDNKEKKLKICCFTYNLHGIGLDKIQISNLLTKHKNKDFDIFVISTQESQRSIAWNLVYYDKSYFETDLENFFTQDYIKLETITLGGIHLIIFVKAKYKDLITNYRNEYVKTGWYGFLGNKGAIGISFKLFNLTFLFINNHLTHGREYFIERNDEFDYIKKNIHPKIDKIDFIFWMGDFNYRTNKTVEEAEKLYKEGNEMALLEFDQLNQQIKDFKLKAYGYNEGKINFLPTFKYSDEKNEIICDSDEHIPSWTDRILWKVNNEKYKIQDMTKNNIEINKSNDKNQENKDKDNLYFKLLEYNSMYDIIYSDHKPVYSYFEINYE